MRLNKPYRLVPALLIASALSAEEINPFVHFYVDGELIGDRFIAIGDPENWYSRLAGTSGSSASGKITVSAATRENENDAIHISWGDGSQAGVFTLGGPPQDLTPLVNEGALIIEMKVDLLSKKAVSMGLDCGYPCGSERDVRPALREFPRKEWFTFAVPINCFTLNEAAENFDISKVTGAMFLRTDGKMEMTISDVRLGLLPEGDPGCRTD